jgi:hypothetical protein
MTKRLRARASRDFPDPGSAEEIVRLVEAAADDERIQAAIVLAAVGDVKAIRSRAKVLASTGATRLSTANLP